MLTHETVPFYFMTAYTYWYNEYMIVCPLPKKFPSLYNIITPLNLTTWCLVLGALVTTSATFVVINHVYKSLRQLPSGWKWLELFLVLVFKAF